MQPGVVNTSATGSYSGGTSGDSGRVMSIREVAVRSGSLGASSGTLVGGLLDAVGGAIAGTAIDSGGSQRGIEVTVQKDDGQTIVIAQADKGDVQMGDRVRIVQDRNGVASAIRDTSNRRDL